MKDKICVCFLCFLGIDSPLEMRQPCLRGNQLYSLESYSLCPVKSFKKKKEKFSADLLKIE